MIIERDCTSTLVMIASAYRAEKNLYSTIYHF